jgi:DNA-binding IclR family transcriptional regulator
MAFRSGVARRGSRDLSTTSDRILSILALFSGERWKWTIEEVSTSLGVPTSTAYRYFKILTNAELITPQGGGAYSLGPAVCELDRAMRMHDPFINAARGEMERLAAENGDSIVLLTRLYKDKVMCVHREGDALIAQGYERGRPMPLDRGAASKVILAHLSSRHLRAVPYRELGEGKQSQEELRRELRAIQARGYSVTHAEIDEGKIGISVPVFRRHDQLEGSLSFVIGQGREAEVERLVAQLIRSRKAVEANLLIADYEAGGVA